MHVTGRGNVVAYDDSTVFVDHTGPVNTNTGDTDTSALNAIDVTGSAITTGDSGGTDHTPETSTGPDDDEDPDAPEPAEQPGVAGASAQAAPGAGSLVVGGDGVDDLSVHTTGQDNVVAVEDSTVSRGGTGAVNAQVGDADTAGALAMAVHDSTLSTGCAAENCTHNN